MTDPVMTWICCPRGIDDGNLRLAVVAIPRLADAGLLSDAAALGDWPRQIRDARWRLALGTRPADAVAVSTADSDLWRALFPSTTPVRSFGSEVDRSGLTQVTYPLREVAETVRAAYAAAAGTDRGDPAARGAAALDADFDLRPLDRVGGPAGDAHPSAVARAFAMQQPRPGRDGAAAEPAPVDFHQVLTLLGDHPTLLRALGLVVDLAVPLTSLGEVAPTRIRVDESSTLPGAVTHARPWTAVTIDTSKRRFSAQDRGAAVGGVWDVSTSDFHLETLDVDGAVRQAVALASAPASSDAGPAEPPALRNDGISLVKSGRAVDLHGRLASALARRQSAGTGDDWDDLTAADLVRGYRVDVRDDVSDEFRSLHARRVHYTIDGFGPYPRDGLPVHDEGLFQESILGDTEMYVHESLVTWRGWSLSAPRPGPAVARTQPSSPGSGRWAALRASMQVDAEPRTLPALRFGRTYQFRLRTVDLAGQSLPVDKAPDVASATLTYLRYEPVAPPVLAPAGTFADLREGQSLHRLVVRQHLPDPDGLLMLGPDPAERLILPPRGSLSLAEEHGVLDDLLRDREPSRRDLVGGLLSRATTDLTYPVGEFAPYLPDPQAMGVVFQDLPGVVSGEIVPVLFETDGWERVRPIRFRLAAPASLSAPPQPTYDGATQTLTVFLPEGARCTVRVSAIPKDPAVMALLRDCSERLTDAELDRISDMASGTHPMFTPYVELELVHAVYQPQVPGFRGEVRPVRARDESPVGLLAALAVDPQTSDSVSLHAQWSDFVDRGADGVPETVSRSEEVFVWRLPPSASTELPAIEGDDRHRHRVDFDTDRLELPRHQLGDTGYRQVTYTPVATSRFGDCYPPGSLLPAVGSPAVVRVLNSATPPPPVVHSVVPSQWVGEQWVEDSQNPPENQPVEEPNPAYDLPHTPGWTRITHARKGGGIRVYLERPWFVTGAEESLGVVVLDPSMPMPTVPNAPDDIWVFDPGDPRSQWISMAGRDPIRSGRGVGRLGRDDFRNATQVRNLGALQDAWEDGGKGGWQLPVTVLGHVPQFEESTGLWYADIEVDADKAHMPFFRLAVGRYQPNSLSEEVSLSRVSTIDFVQPLPSRTLTVLRHGNDPMITVTLRGTTYPSWEGAPRPAEVSAELFFAAPHETDAWHAVEEADRFALIRDDTDSYWTATMVLPDPLPEAALRLLVVEHEVMQALGADGAARRAVYVGTIDL